MKQSRRDFLSTAAVAAGYFVLPTGRTAADEAKSPNNRPRLGAIGVGERVPDGGGGRGRQIAPSAKRLGDYVAVCDVDLTHADKFNQDFAQGQAAVCQDYRKLLDRKDVDAVLIATPDHWHTRICIDAMRAGKDVYCEKPLTLTIDEGKQLCRVVRETGRVLQVGTQQRSEFANRFLKAVALVRAGRIGKVKRVVCQINAGPAGGPFPAKQQVPPRFDWDSWLGQAPKLDYMKERCHWAFRWWYEYSGGKLTDWGAHHVDIAQWAIGMDKSGPLTIETVRADLPNPQIHGRPACADCYNTPTTFDVRCRFANGIELVITSTGVNGITFEGETGTFFVSRGKLTGPPVDDLKAHPLPDDALVTLRKGKRASSHMANFIECCRDRSQPVSDVYSHHRSLTTCHLANISIRLDRKLTWDPAKEEIVGDAEANGYLRREQRKGYETNV
jgi:predicted dehydrogenase